MVHKGSVYPGEHEAILDRTLFEAVRAKLAENVVQLRAKQAASNALLIGKLFDDAGNVMSPTHCRKQGIRYRYYTSRAFIEGRKQEAGSIPRVAAEDIEGKVIETLKSHQEISRWVSEYSEKTLEDKVATPVQSLMQSSTQGTTPSQDPLRDTIRLTVGRVDIKADHLMITLTNAAADIAEQPTLTVSWLPRPKKPKRDLIVPSGSVSAKLRPMHAERRAKQLRAIAIGRKWLSELIEGISTEVDQIAKREGRSARSVQMMISLAFVAPDIVEAAISGRLPRGMGITPLADLPTSWRAQRATLGIAQPVDKESSLATSYSP